MTLTRLTNGGKRVLDCLFGQSFALKMAMMVVTLFTAVPPIHDAYGKYVKVLLAWGMVVLVVDIVRTQRALRNRYAAFLALFSVSYGVTSLLCRAQNFSTNLSQLAYMVLFFFVLFAYDLDKPKETIERELVLLARVFIVITVLYSLFGFATFLTSYSAIYVQKTGLGKYSHLFIGMHDNRLHGLYNCNTGSTLNLLSCAFSMLLLRCRPQKAITRVAHAGNLLLQYLCLLLTLSRAAWYMLAVFCGLFVFFVLPRFRVKCGELLKAAAAVAAAALVIAANTPIKAVLAYAPAVVADWSDGKWAFDANDPVMLGKVAATTAAIDPENKVDFNRVDSKVDGGLLTGRQELWKGGLEALKQSPWFGISYANMCETVTPFVPKYWQENLTRGGLHNIAVTVLVCSGVVGFAIMAAFLLLSGGRLLRLLWKRRGDPDAAAYNTIVLMLLAILGVEMMEARILYVVTVFGVLFWILYGYAAQLADLSEPEKAARTGVWGRLTRLRRQKRGEAAT